MSRILVCARTNVDKVFMEHVSHEDVCRDCQIAIFIGKKGAEAMRVHHDMHPVCMRCAVRNHGLRPDTPVTELSSGNTKSLDGSVQ
jgi:ribosomal protein L40E